MFNKQLGPMNKVLIVDASPTESRTMVTLLTKTGYDPVTAEDLDSQLRNVNDVALREPDERIDGGSIIGCRAASVAGVQGIHEIARILHEVQSKRTFLFLLGVDMVESSQK